MVVIVLGGLAEQELSEGLRGMSGSCQLSVDGRHKRLVSEHKIFMYIQNLSNKKMKKNYLMPTIELEELVVESGIAQSLPGVEIDGWDEDGGVTIDF